MLTRKAWNVAALVVWSVALSVVIIRAVLLPHRALMLNVYEQGGRHWTNGLPLYGGPPGGYLYSPLIAVFFALLLGLPNMLRPVIWIVVGALVFLVAVRTILRSRLYPAIDERYSGIVLLLLLPLLLGNFDMTQANPLTTGLIIIGIVAAFNDSWSLAAACLAIAVYFKLYPIVVGLLLILVAPKQFGWRLLLALLLLGMLPFLFQRYDYVAAQYHLWLTTLLHDNRLNYDITMAPIDLWLVLVRLGKLNIKPWVYQIVQILSGIGIALYCLVAAVKQWDRRRLFVGLFSLTCIWMTLVGPATEGLTYALLVPAVILAAVNAMAGHQSGWRQVSVLLSLGLFLLAVTKNSFAPHLFGVWTRALQPVAAVVFLVYCVSWLLADACWRDRSSLAPAAMA